MNQADDGNRDPAKNPPRKVLDVLRDFAFPLIVALVISFFLYDSSGIGFWAAFAFGAVGVLLAALIGASVDRD